MSSNSGLKPIQIYMQKNNSNFIQSTKNQRQPSFNVYAKTQQKKNNNFLEQREKAKTPAPAISLFNQTQNNNKRTQYNRSMSELQSGKKQQQKSNDKTAIYKQQSQNLGKQSLMKIQRLLTEIGTPKAKKSTKKKQQNIEEDYQKSQRILKLYNKHQQRINNLSQVQAKRAYDQYTQLKDFKVSNKTSLYLNEKNKKLEKPLYQRSKQIAEERQKKLLQIRMKKANQQMKAYLQQQQQALKIRENRSKRVAWQQIQKKMQEMKEKERQRQNRKNSQRINIVKQMSRNYQQKPSISPISKKIFQKIMNQNDYHKDFVRRNEQYQIQRKLSKNNIIEKYKAQYTPFHPQISQATKEITKNRQAKAFLNQKSVSPSVSCKCFKKGTIIYGNGKNQTRSIQHSIHNKSTGNLTKTFRNISPDKVSNLNKKPEYLK